MGIDQVTQHDHSSDSEGGTSISPGDVDIGGSDFVSSGDVLTLIQWGTSSNNQTTSDTYDNVHVGDLDHMRLAWNDTFPSDATVFFTLVGRMQGNDDQLDVRLRNVADGETILEMTGVTGDFEAVQVGPVTYEPTTKDGIISIQAEIRNADNATTVRIQDTAVHAGVQL